MPGLLNTAMLAGTKRLHQADHADNGAVQQPPAKRRLVHHQLCHQQPHLAESIFALQDPVFIQGQLLRSIGMSLKAVGFDSALPSALEGFRAEVEEYMLRFLKIVTQSMGVARRTQPIPQDFILALSRQQLAPSSLMPHLEPLLPASATQPSIPPPAPAEPPPPNLEGMLGPILTGASDKAERRYIPSHFPNFPSKHTWQATHVYTSREIDPGKIRERATQEGILAEQALRKLMSASKGAKGLGKTKPLVAGAKPRKRSGRQELDGLWEETMAALLKEEEEDQASSQQQQNREVDMFGDSMDVRPVRESNTRKEKSTEASDGGMLVDYERKYWRKAAAGH